MEKRVSVLLAVLLLLLAACGAKPTGESLPPSAGDPSDVTAPPEETSSAFSFTVGDARLVLGETADVEALFGTALEVLEAPSCVHEGNDTLYEYGAFGIVTSPSAQGAYVSSVTLYTDAAATEEGVRIGDSVDAALAAYGGAYDADASYPDFGIYVFVRGATSITMVADESGAVTAISYAAE